MRLLVRLAGGLALLALVAAAAGCGSDSDSTSANDSPTVVAPDGAPYSYEVPSGFEEASTTFPGDGPRFLTGVILSDGPAQSGGLSTFQWTLDAPQRAYSTKRLLRWLDKETLAFYRGAGATLTAGERTEIAGRPAICWQVQGFRNESEGLVDANGCAIVGTEDVVQQSCLWKPETREEIERGCRELRATLKVS